MKMRLNSQKKSTIVANIKNGIVQFKLNFTHDAQCHIWEVFDLRRGTIWCKTKL